LSANGFGDGIAGMHAGITAEGDNRVICQKVSKELLELADRQAVSKHLKLRSKSLEEQHSLNNIAGDVQSTEWQMKLFRSREQFLLNELAGRLFLANKAGTPLFTTWMQHESDNVQALATSWGENIALEQFDNAIKSASAEIQPTLRKLFSLYALDRILADGVFYLTNGFITPKQSQAITVEVQKLCHELGKDALELTRGFGIPDHLHHAPIANNWVKYNEYENRGEFADQSYRSNS
jgi:acyl-CoA oxidase